MPNIKKKGVPKSYAFSDDESDEDENEDEDEDYLHDIPEGNLKDWSEEGEFDIKGIVKDAFDDV